MSKLISCDQATSLWIANIPKRETDKSREIDSIMLKADEKIKEAINNHRFSAKVEYPVRWNSVSVITKAFQDLGYKAEFDFSGAYSYFIISGWDPMNG